MFHGIELGIEFFEGLAAIDEAIVEAAAEETCSECGGPLHRGDYPRKPRGGLVAVAGETFGRRFSLCCGREGCRRRATPPSVRFLGRRVYVGAVVIVASVVALAAATASAATRATGIAARTTRRWLRWWRGPFTRRVVRGAVGRLVPAVERRALPTSILDRLTGAATGRVTQLLPGSRRSPPDDARDVALDEGPRVIAFAGAPRRRWRDPVFPAWRRVSSTRALLGGRGARGGHGPTTTTRPRACDGHVCAFRSSARCWPHRPRSGELKAPHRGARRPHLAAPDDGRERALFVQDDRAMVLRRAGGKPIRWRRSRARCHATPARTRAISAPLAEADRSPAPAASRGGPSSSTTTTCSRSRERTRRSVPMPGYATLRRYMKHHGLLRVKKKRHRAAPTAPTPLHARARRVPFEVAHVHGLWHLDFHEGSRAVLTAAGEWKKPQLLGILDDHSRLCCHLQWYPDGRAAESLVHGLSQAFQKRGLPRALLTDNGGAMLAAETIEGLERLGIVHHTTLPVLARAERQARVLLGADRRPPARRCSRARRTSRSSCSTAPRRPGSSRSTTASCHSEIKETPLARYLRGPSCRRDSPCSDALRRAFRMEITAYPATERRHRSPSTACASSSPPPIAPSCASECASRAGTCPPSTSVDPRSGVHLGRAPAARQGANAERVGASLDPCATPEPPPAGDRAAPARADGRLRRDRVAAGLRAQGHARRGPRRRPRPEDP